MRPSDRELALRAGDADRERAAAELRRHHLDGRLDAGELEERLGRAYAAVTLGDLAGLLGDLPVVRVPSAERAPAPPQKVGGYGLLPFAQAHELPVPVDAAYQEALRSIAGAMSRYGFRLSERHDGQTLIFQREERPVWVYVLCVALFPFGILALLLKHVSEVRVDFVPLPGERSRLQVTGKARRPVRKALLQISG